MKARKPFIFLLVLCIPFTLFAQIKKLDDSGRQPDWAENTLAQGYIIGVSSASTLEKARDKAIMDVKKQITEAIAVQLTTVSSSMINELIVNEESSISSNYQRETQSQSAKRDFLMGISASKVDDYYWEHLRNKDTDREYYTYWVKYPFSDADLDRLVFEFREKDRELTLMLNELLATTEDFLSVEELESCMDQLQKLADMFLDDRKQKAEVGIEKCRGLLKSIYIADKGSTAGIVKYSLQIGDKVITTSKTPRIQSNCAEIQKRVFGKEINEITYDDEYCYDEPGNYVEVTYRISNNTLSKKFPVDAAADEFEIVLLGEMTLYPEEGKIRMRIDSKYDTPVVIKIIELNNDAMKLNLYEEVSEKITDQGIEDVTIRLSPFEIREGYTSVEVNGYIHYENAEGQERKSIRVYRQKARVVR